LEVIPILVFLLEVVVVLTEVQVEPILLEQLEFLRKKWTLSID
jgi:hypothetical protein